MERARKLANIPTNKKMQDALRTAGLRITRQRKAIVEYLSSTDIHPSARRVFDDVKKREPNLSLATVYNTLGSLVRMGLIKVMEFESLDNRYDTNLSPHINLICMICGMIQDWEERFPIRPEDLKAQLGFELLDHRMEYYGICEVCRSQTKKQDSE